MMRIRARRQSPLAFAVLLLGLAFSIDIDRTPLFCRAQEQGEVDILPPSERLDTATTANQVPAETSSSEKKESPDILNDGTTIHDSHHNSATATSTSSEEETQTHQESGTVKAKESSQSHVGDGGETPNSSLAYDNDSTNNSGDSSKEDTNTEAKGENNSESTKSEESPSNLSGNVATDEAKEESDGTNNLTGEGSSSSEERDDNTMEDVSQQHEEENVKEGDSNSPHTTDTAPDNATATDNTATDSSTTTITESIESKDEADKTFDNSNEAQPDDSASSDDSTTTTNDTEDQEPSVEQDKSSAASEETDEKPTLVTNESEVENDSQGEPQKEETLEKSPEKPTSTMTKPTEQDYFDLDDDNATTGNGSSDADDQDQAKHEDYKPAPSTEEETIVAEEEAIATTEGEKKKPPKEGSLASFMQKVKDQKGQNLSGNPPDAAVKDKATNEPTVPTTQDSNLPSNSSSNEGTNDSSSSSTTATSTHIQYQTPWGQFTGKKYADLHILGLTFNKNLAAEAATRYRKVFEPLDLVIPTLYTKIMGKNAGTGSKATDKADPTADPIAPPLKERLSSPNADFVEGLDDIDKFFEEVDPPDELDVGAGGTSIQDVLMGQTTKIVIKRVVLGAQYVSRTAKAAAIHIHQYFANKDDDDDGDHEPKEFKFPKLNLKNLKLDKEHLTKAGKWTVEQGKTLWGAAREFFADLFGGEDESDEFANYANDLQKKLQEMTGEAK